MKRSILIAIIVGAVVVVAAVVGIVVAQRFGTPTAAPTANQSGQTPTPAHIAPPAPATFEPPPPLSAGDPTKNPDADSDNLLKDQELKLGTNPDDPDTDHDGLYDGFEINVSHTDPKKPDTDGNGALDGPQYFQSTPRPTVTGSGETP